MKRDEILNTVVSYTGAAISFFIVFLRARVFSPAEVGVFSYVLSVGIIVSNFLNLGIPRIILRYYPSEQKKPLLRFILIFQLLVYFFVIAVFFTTGMSRYVQNPIPVSVIAILISIASILDAAAIATGQSVHTNIYQKIISNSLDIAVLYVLSVMSVGVESYILLFALTRIILIILMAIRLRPEIFKRRIQKITATDLQEYLKFGFFVMLNTTSAVLIVTIDKIMIRYFVGFTGVGLYTISAAVASAIALINAILSRTATSIVSSYLHESRYSELKALYKENVGKQIYLGSFLFVFIVIFSKEILGFMGEEYLAGRQVLMILLIGQFAMLLSGLGTTILSLSKYYRIEVAMNGGLFALAILTNLIFIPWMKIEGAALATGISLTTVNAVKVLIVMKYFQIHPYRAEQLRYPSIAALLGCGLYFVKHHVYTDHVIIMILTFPIALLLYDVLLIFTGDFNTITSQFYRYFNRLFSRSSH